MPKAKKFIDRKSAVTFSLVHRSQRDPLAADDTAPQRVLVPVSASVPGDTQKQPELTAEQRRAEQQKYGVYFDDDYNYLQHLRGTKEVTMLLQPKATHKRKDKSSDESEQKSGVELQLPSSVFASEVEEDVGLLNKAAPQGLRLDLDPEVVAAMDEDFDFEDPDNQLEDNFMELAMAEGSGDEYTDDEEADSDGGSEKSFPSDQEYDSDDQSQGSSDDRGPPKWDKFGAEETKSRFSQYSMSSSVIRRNQGLDLLDHRFEKMFAEYDDTELGALDCEEIEGTLPSTHRELLKAAEEFEAHQERRRLDKEKEIARITRLQEIAEESTEEEMERVPVGGKVEWDCESILSTYSNIYNHPKLIDEPKKPSKIKLSKAGIPLDTIKNDSNKLTAKSLARFNAELAEELSDDDGRTHAESILSTLSVLSIRPKEESAEEKKERKRLLKEYRKERRLEKRANRDAFKEEKKRQEKILMNNRNNVQGNRIL